MLAVWVFGFVLDRYGFVGVLCWFGGFGGCVYGLVVTCMRLRECVVFGCCTWSLVFSGFCAVFVLVWVGCFDSPLDLLCFLLFWGVLCGFACFVDVLVFVFDGWVVYSGLLLLYLYVFFLDFVGCFVALADVIARY